MITFLLSITTSAYSESLTVDDVLDFANLSDSPRPRTKWRTICRAVQAKMGIRVSENGRFAKYLGFAQKDLSARISARTKRKRQNASSDDDDHFCGYGYGFAEGRDVLCIDL
jgi:hypothetical protein